MQPLDWAGRAGFVSPHVLRFGIKIGETPMAQSFVVVGAYGGVGDALCRRLARRGARVLMAGRDPGTLAQLAADIGGETVALDATEPDQVEACLRRAAAVFGRLDGVANCVGSLRLPRTPRKASA